MICLIPREGVKTVKWLGRQGSNLGMRDPKSRDLPLVDAPKKSKKVPVLKG